jgi:hypothetical protein
VEWFSMQCFVGNCHLMKKQCHNSSKGLEKASFLCLTSFLMMLKIWLIDCCNHCLLRELNWEKSLTIPGLV